MKSVHPIRGSKGGAGDREEPPVAPPRKRIRCLVLQLGQAGDLLQSLMAIRAAKQLYPHLDVELVVRDKCEEIAARVPWIHSVTALPDALTENSQALASAAAWLAPLSQTPWDLLINWSYSESSSFLAGIIPSRIKLGYSRRSDASFSCSDGWSHYIQAIVHGGIRQNIHFTDILTTQALTALQIHFGEPTLDENVTGGSRGFFALKLATQELASLWPSWREPSRKWIGLYIGRDRSGSVMGSARANGWTTEKWIRLATLILDRHPECGLLLLGTPADKARAQALLAACKSPRVASLVERTGFDLQASVIGRCQWIITEEASSAHLAGILGTRVVSLASADGPWRENGPYGNGHYIIASSKPLAAEAVYATWAYASSEWVHRRQFSLEKHFARLGWSDKMPDAGVHRARIRGTSDGGGVVYESLTERPLSVADWTSQVIGHIARAWYCGWLPPIGAELARAEIEPALMQTLRQLDESSAVLAKICDEAKRTARSLQQKCGTLKSEKVMGMRDRQAVTELGSKLTELDQLITRLASNHTPLLGFAYMSRVLMHNLKGSKLMELGRESAEAYQQLGQGVGILREWIRHTVDLAKPVALRVVPPSPRKKAPEPEIAP